ncbi:MAG TPA: lysophospholipid acyltransferase family protein [Candidatus Paceibacterota bacterium]|nr:lysophospholipid acyltransferase family protein [Candidatus Paceibacterota bacterium]
MTVENPKPPTQNPKRQTRRSGVIVPHQPTRIQRLGAWIVFLALRSVMMTLRYRWNDPLGVVQNPSAKPVIFTIWHNRLALCLEAYRVYNRRRGGLGMAAMVSASKDGGFLAGILECFKVQPVRGSSSRRGPQALLELTSWGERGYDLAITPDGPRGPCYVVQEGVMSLAQLTGLPIIPFSYNLGWKIRLKSWDRFQIPLPFSKCEMNVGTPIHVPREATDAERAELRLRLENALKELSKD